MDKERRRHPRRDILMAALVTPNGHSHSAEVLDVSEGGARLWLPEDDWTPTPGAPLRLSFEDDPSFAIRGQVVRVCIDHLGVEFAQAQEREIGHLLLSLT